MGDGGRLDFCMGLGGEAVVRLCCLFFPKTLGELFTHLSLTDQARCVVATFHLCMFPLSWMNYCRVHMRALL